MIWISLKNKHEENKTNYKNWFDQSIEQSMMGNKPKIIRD